MPRRRALITASALLCLSAATAFAASCSVSTSGLGFGVYDPFSHVALDSAGDISVSCDATLSYSLSLSMGSGSIADRRLSSGAHALHYNLYSDAARLQVWGDGSSGTSPVQGNSATAHHAVYGRVPAGQNAYAGAYADSVVLTLSY